MREHVKFKFPIGNRGLKSGGGKRENETIMIIDIHEKLDENFKKDTDLFGVRFAFVVISD